MALLERVQADDRQLRTVQDNYAATLEPLLRNVLNHGVLLKGVSLAASPTANEVSHKLSRALQGWVCVAKRAQEPRPSEGWITPTLLNSWVNNGAYGDARYLVDAAGTVWIDGAVKNGTMILPVFTLPAAYAPEHSMAFPVYSYNGVNQVLASLFVNPNGDVLPFAGSNNEFHLNGVSFRSLSANSAKAILWDDQASNLIPDKTLRLYSTCACVADLYVF